MRSNYAVTHLDFLLLAKNRTNFWEKWLLVRQILLADLSGLNALLKTRPGFGDLLFILCDLNFFLLQRSKQRFSVLESVRVQVLAHDVRLVVEGAGKLPSNVLVGEELGK